MLQGKAYSEQQEKGFQRSRKRIAEPEQQEPYGRVIRFTHEIAPLSFLKAENTPRGKTTGLRKAIDDVWDYVYNSRVKNTLETTFRLLNVRSTLFRHRQTIND